MGHFQDWRGLHVILRAEPNLFQRVIRWIIHWIMNYICWIMDQQFSTLDHRSWNNDPSKKLSKYNFQTLPELWRWGMEPWTVEWSVFTDSKTGCSVVRVPIVVASVYPSNASGCYSNTYMATERQPEHRNRRRTVRSTRRQLAWPNSPHP